MIRARLAELEALRQNGIGTMVGGLEFELNKKRVREQVGWNTGVCAGRASLILFLVVAATQ